MDEYMVARLMEKEYVLTEKFAREWAQALLDTINEDGVA